MSNCETYKPVTTNDELQIHGVRHQRGDYIPPRDAMQYEQYPSVLNPELQRHLQRLADAKEAPVGMVTQYFLTFVSSMIRRRLVGKFGERQNFGNIFTIALAESGTGKSTGMEYFQEIYVALEDENQPYEASRADQDNRQRMAAEKRKKKILDELDSRDLRQSSMTPESEEAYVPGPGMNTASEEVLKEELSRLNRRLMRPELIAATDVHGDVTPAKFEQACSKRRGIGFLCDSEPECLQAFTGRTGADKIPCNVASLLGGYSSTYSKRERVTEKGNLSRVLRTYTLCFGVQPQFWSTMPESCHQQGFTGRVLWANFSPEQVNRSNLDPTQTPEAKMVLKMILGEAYNFPLESLNQAQLPPGTDENTMAAPQPVECTASPEAMHFLGAQSDFLRGERVREDLKQTLKRMPENTQRLSLVLHFTDWLYSRVTHIGGVFLDTIPLDTVQRASTLMSYYRRQMERLIDLDSNLPVQEQIEDAVVTVFKRDLAKRTQDAPMLRRPIAVSGFSFTFAELRRRNPKFANLTAQDIESAMAGLIARNAIVELERHSTNGEKGGRPTTRYAITESFKLHIDALS